jgi:hypothetical protein
MFFFFKPTTIVVDAFTSNDAAHDYYPIAKSNRHVPNWWKALPATLDDPVHRLVKRGTVKRCQGFVDLYSNSFSIPLWSDISIEMELIADQKIWRYKFADKKSWLDSHDQQQYNGIVDYSKYQQLKFNPPWFLEEKSGVKFMMSQHTWNIVEESSNFTVLPGIIDFKYQSSVNISTMVRYPEVGLLSMMFEAGTPLVHLTPLTDKRVEIKTHLISATEFERKHPMTKFVDNYKERKTRIDEQESKCPFTKWRNSL